MASTDEESLQIMTAQVLSLFPDISQSAVSQDLSHTNSVEETTKRILDGLLPINSVSDSNPSEKESISPGISHQKSAFQRLKMKYSCISTMSNESNASNSTEIESLSQPLSVQNKIPQKRPERVPTIEAKKQKENRDETQVQKSPETHVHTDIKPKGRPKMTQNRTKIKSDVALTSPASSVAFKNVEEAKKVADVVAEPENIVGKMTKKEQAALAKVEKAKVREKRRLDKKVEGLQKKMRVLNRIRRKELTPGECQKASVTCLYDGVYEGSTCDEYPTVHRGRPFTIGWVRRTSNHTLNENTEEIVKDWSTTIENTICLIYQAEEFAKLIRAYGDEIDSGLSSELLSSDCLRLELIKLQELFYGRRIIILVSEFEKYLRKYENAVNKKFRDNVRNNRETSSQKARKKDSPITRRQLEEAICDAQLWTGVATIRLCTDPTDIAEFVRCLSKSVAERKHKESRLVLHDFSIHFSDPTTRSVRIDPTNPTTDQQTLWKGQLTQFKSVSSEMAAAIVESSSKFSTLPATLRSFNECEDELKARNLVTNVEVKRGYGVLQTSRKVGRNISARVYDTLTNSDSNWLLSGF